MLEFQPTSVAVAQRPSQERLQQAFLEQMLTHILPDPKGEFSGGSGEEQFKTFLCQNYAEAVSDKLNFGISV